MLSFVQDKIKEFRPQIGIVLGSGLSYFAEKYIQNPLVIPYSTIPNFPVSTVPGHAGNLIFGTVEGRNVVCMQGRFHLYEGYTAQEVTQPIRLMIALGIQSLIVTNAAGGIRPGMKPGELMFIKDHINFLGTNPLIGQKQVTDSERFPDMSFAYDKEYIRQGLQIAKKNNILASQGIYLATKGPSFETPAEIKAFGILGADAVGMSTVPEVIVARQKKIRVCGISCISNLAAGISPQELSHTEVNETVHTIKRDFATLVKSLIKQIE